MMLQCLIKTSPIIDAYLRHCYALEQFYIQDALSLGIKPTFCYIESGADAYFIVQATKEELLPNILPNCAPVDLTSISKQASASFFIRLNPAVKVKRPIGERVVDKLEPITDPEMFYQWVISKLRDEGLAVKAMETLQKGVAPSARGMQIINESVVHINADIGESVLANGFFEIGTGKRKSFGYGMPVIKGTPGYTLLSSIFKIK